MPIPIPEDALETDDAAAMLVEWAHARAERERDRERPIDSQPE